MYQSWLGRVREAEQIDREVERLNFEKRQTEWLAQIPEEFRSFVRTYSWEQGHSSGYNEVLNIAEDLIYHLTRAVENYKMKLMESSGN
jgi:hypothetical protein